MTKGHIYLINLKLLQKLSSIFFWRKLHPAATRLKLALANKLAFQDYSLDTRDVYFCLLYIIHKDSTMIQMFKNCKVYS